MHGPRRGFSHDLPCASASNPLLNFEMLTAIRGRRRTFVPADGSRKLTITNDPTQEDSDEEQMSSEGENIVGSLRLRGGHKRRQRVAWGEDVVDNEGCGKKKSKSKSLNYTR